MWHQKEPSLRKAMSAKHRAEFTALSQVMVTAARSLTKLLRRLQTNKPNTWFEAAFDKVTCFNIKKLGLL
jgi:hypothetical protein